MVWPTSQAWLDKFNPKQDWVELVKRVEVWSPQGKPTGVLPVGDGAVKDDWVSGARRSLSISVSPTAEARAMLLPGVELRVYSGINFGYQQPELVPHGCFPLTDTSLDEVADGFPLNAIDRYQWVVRNDFSVPTATTVGMKVQEQAARFIAGCGRWRLSDVQQLATSQAKVVTSQVFDTSLGGRAQAVTSLLQTIGAEVFVSRSGLPVIRDRAPLGATAGSFRPGDGGRLRVPASVSLSEADVFNSVRVSSSNTDPAFALDEVTVSITDPNHPAYPRFGVYRTWQMDSAQYSSKAQMLAAGQKELTKRSRQARQVSMTAVAPDASLDASDTVLVHLPSVGADERLQVQSITHPLSPAGTQDIVLVSTRSDEDES